MSKRKTDYREPLDPEMVTALLSEVPDKFTDTVGERLEQAVDELCKMVALARHTLSQNVLTGIVAKEAARRANRRGIPTLEVGTDGVVYLVVSYGKNTDRGDTRQWTSDLPSIRTLRQEAEALGIDPTLFGRRKRELLQAIEDVQKVQLVPTKVSGKMFRTGQAVSPVTMVNPIDPETTRTT